MMFEKNRFYGYLIKGDLLGAIDYLKKFPEQKNRYHKYRALFEDGQLLHYDAQQELRQILDIYQKYYRDVFYLQAAPETAEETMLARFSALFGLEMDSNLYDTAEERIVDAFTAKGYHILCGKTGGYFGPYIWKTTEVKTYEVELPDGVQTYTIHFLNDFISRSWLDYLSFGDVGTGGWTDGNGIINCVKESYNTESENFRVSLLKHEAQHAMDLSRFPSMCSQDLEYRAKLVELIYSEERNMLEQFCREADTARAANGHSIAASRIAAEFAGVSDIPEIQRRALALFRKSDSEMGEKYSNA